LPQPDEEQQSLRSEELELEAQRDILSETEFNLRLEAISG
jgi:hypothetical protein